MNGAPTDAYQRSAGIFCSACHALNRERGLRRRIAAARALRQLADRLLDVASDEIVAVEGHAVGSADESPLRNLPGGR